MSELVVIASILVLCSACFVVGCVVGVIGAAEAVRRGKVKGVKIQ